MQAEQAMLDAPDDALKYLSQALLFAPYQSVYAGYICIFTTKKNLNEFMLHSSEMVVNCQLLVCTGTDHLQDYSAHVFSSSLKRTTA